jgi:hypothetical protein
MSLFAAYEPEELKLIYRLLRGHLLEQPLLLDSPLYEDLERHLERLACVDEVDPRARLDWERWLRNEAPVPGPPRLRLLQSD